MKKTLLFIMSFIMLFGAAMQTASAEGVAFTAISGEVRDQNGNLVPNASISANCNGFIKTAVTNAQGDYDVYYSQEECKSGDNVSVSASSSAGNGSNAETVENGTSNPFADIDIAVVNITVPEMGTVMAMVAAAGGLGAFYYMRRQQMTA